MANEHGTECTRGLAEAEAKIATQKSTRLAEELTLEDLREFICEGFTFYTARYQELVRLLAAKSGGEIIDETTVTAPCSDCGKENTATTFIVTEQFTANAATVAALGLGYQEAAGFLQTRLHETIPDIERLIEPGKAIAKAFVFGIAVGIAANKATPEEQERAKRLSARAGELSSVLVGMPLDQEEEDVIRQSALTDVSEGAKQRIC